MRYEKMENGHMLPTFFCGKAEEVLQEYSRKQQEGEDVTETLAEVFYEQYVADESVEMYYLTSLYTMGTEKEKALIDAVLVSLCGWSMPSLLNMCLKKGKE